jgi:hypothetical protein
MRNAAICVGAMLTLLTVWPAAFGRAPAAPPLQAQRGTATVTMAVPAPVALKTAPLSRPLAELLPALKTRAGESCARRYQRTNAVCTDQSCHLAVADAADVCEATGFWPA